MQFIDRGRIRHFIPDAAHAGFKTDQRFGQFGIRVGRRGPGQHHGAIGVGCQLDGAESGDFRGELFELGFDPGHGRGRLDRGMLKRDFLSWTDTRISVRVLAALILIELVLRSLIALPAASLPTLIAQLSVLTVLSCGVGADELVVGAIATDEAGVLLAEGIATAQAALLTAEATGLTAEAATQPALTAEATLASAAAQSP